MSDAKILFIGNEDQSSKFVTQVSEAFPLRFLQADTLESALVTARQERPELILFAADLPGLDAIGGCAAFKADDELRTIPVVVLASGNDGDAELFRKAGCDVYLTMPMDRKKCFTYLHQYIPCLEVREERVPCHSHVTIRDEDEVFYGMTGDISGGGLFVATFDRLPAEGEIRLSFTLPEVKNSLVETRGRVVWLNSKSRPVSTLPEGFGIEFTSISRDEFLLIKEYIAAARKNPQP